MERTYTTRDNATRALRKRGISKDEYSKFLRRLDDGKFAIVQETATEQATSGDVEEERPIVPFNGSDVAALSTKPLRMDPVEDYDSKANASFKPKPKAAKPKAAKPKAVKPKAAKPKAAKPKAAKPKAAKPKAAKPKVSGELTVASEARRLILEGLDNAAVFKKLQAMFKVGDEKRNYPSWYRCQLRRQGRIK